MARSASRYPTILFAIVVLVALAQVAWWTLFAVRQSQRYLEISLKEAASEARAAAIELEAETGSPTHPVPLDASIARRWLGARHPRLAFAEGEGPGAPVRGFVPAGRVVVSGETEAALRADARGHVVMFLSEGSFFVVLLLAGVFLLYRTFRLEAQLKRQEADFLAAASHDLRTPLATLQLLSDTLAKGRVPSERLAETYASLADEAERLAIMVDNLIEAGRLERERVSSEEVTDLSEQAQMVLGEMGPYLRKREVVLEQELQDGVAAVLDPASLRSIARNLLENAAKYSRPPRRVRVRTYQRDGVAFLEVTDNGIGIPEAERKRVFQRFYRAESDLSRRERGVGLGLYLVRAFAEAAGGDCVIEPADWGKGTTFRVRLMAAREA